MPEKTLTVATYAAGASLAAITLIYVFAPTYFLDGEASPSGGGTFVPFSSRKKGVVGLVNPANDCFINSVLQALAGLGDLRLYLIREMHRRSLDDAWVYAQPVPADLDAARGIAPGSRRGNMPDWKVEGLQSGIVTKGLKDILDSLNERPIYRKTITAGPFVKTLEVAFRQRISRQQQDAQEFLQVVAERLCDEYHAGRRARSFARQRIAPHGSDAPELPLLGHVGEEDTARMCIGGQEEAADGTMTPALKEGQNLREVTAAVEQDDNGEGEGGFPMEGTFESQIECLTCGFKPRPTSSTFCTLTLNVPQTSATTLNSCFDGMFKTEYIDDFKCEMCRLLHAIAVFEAELQKSTSDSFKAKATLAIEKLRIAVETDPEKPPGDVALPDLRHAPKRRIARHIRMVNFPKVLAIHLSRSIYDASHTSQKNSAKVAFPERLPLGGLLQQRRYKLLGLVTHKGSHQSGHYESFRRQNIYPPFANSNTFQPSGVYSNTASPVSTPQLGALQQERLENCSPLTSSPDLSSPNLSSPDLLTPASGINSSTLSLELTMPPRPGQRISAAVNGRPVSATAKRLGPTSAPREKRENDAETTSLRSVAASARSALSRMAAPAAPVDDISPSSRESLAPGKQPAPPSHDQSPKLRRRKHSDRWWRISDEKIKEASTREVLAMQREVYLLFYEMERESLS